MTRNDADLLRANVLFHLGVGCERVLVVDNGSTDSTQRVLKWLQRIYPVDWTARSEGLPRAELVTELAEHARGRGADWVLPLDTDEFWHSGGPIPDILPSAGEAGALEVPRIEFVQARDQLRSGPRSLVRADRRVETVIRGEAAILQFLAGQRSQFEVAPPAKLLLRTAPGLQIELGAHRAHGLAGPIVTTDRVTIFHLPLRSRSEAATRAEDDRRIRQVDARPEVAYETAYWREMATSGEFEAAWRAHAHHDGVLDVFGRRVELLSDDRLAEILAPYAKSALRSRLGDLRQVLRSYGLRLRAH